MNNDAIFISSGIKVIHGYHFWPDQNIFFCNIPKCASTTIQHYVENNPSLILDEPFYFTIIREPIERLKSALWMISCLHHSPYNFYCPHCGECILEEFNIDDFVKQIKNIQQSGIREKLLMHAFPQSLFINSSTYTGSADLKIYRIDQVDHIFNTKLLKENSFNTNDSPYKLFERNFEDQYSKYASFLNAYYVDDFKLWNSINT